MNNQIIDEFDKASLIKEIHERDTDTYSDNIKSDSWKLLSDVL